MELIIRKATIEDFDSLVDLRLELLKYENSLNSKNKFNDVRIEKSKELIKTYLERSNSVFFVAEIFGCCSSKVVGYIHGTKDENPNELEGYIQGLFVLENYRRKHIGKLLLDSLLEWFDGKKHGLTTDINNELSLNFYKKHGYKLIEKEGQANTDKNNSIKNDVVFMVSE